MGQAVALASVNLANLGYSRADEADADRRGFELMDKAGFDPGASAALFTRLAAMEDEGHEPPLFLRSHPATRARAEAARAHGHQATEIAFTPAEWAAVRAMCGGGPAAPSSGGIAPLPPSQNTGGPAPLPPGAYPGAGGGPAPLPPSAQPFPQGEPPKPGAGQAPLHKL
jgi:hypothetical protein